MRQRRSYTSDTHKKLQSLQDIFQFRDVFLCFIVTAIYSWSLCTYFGFPHLESPAKSQPLVYVCYILHFFKDHYLDEMRDIKNDLHRFDNYRYYWLYDSSGSPFTYHREAHSVGWNVQQINNLEVDKYYPDQSDGFYRLYFGKGKKMPYTHIAWLPYWSTYLSNVEYIWIIEYDTKFHGDWSLFFNAYDKSEADIIAFRHEKHNNDRWGWWRSCPTCRRGNRHNAFYPVARYSIRFLRHLFATVTEDSFKTGHHEAFSTTLCYTTPWCKIQLIDERFRGIVHYRPVIKQNELVKIYANSSEGKFYHPVKD